MTDLPEGFEILSALGLTPTGDPHCPRCKRSDKVTGVELPDIYDGICYWRCERCRVKWSRFGKDQPHRRAAVERYWEDCKKHKEASSD